MDLILPFFRVILPLLGEYVDSGYRTSKDRILYSLRSNGKYQLMVLGGGAAGLVYIIIQNGFHPESIKALVMALAYVWGLTLAIYLMGHGLVAIPRRLYRNANISGKLRRIQSHAPKLHDRLTDAIANLDELETQVSQLRQRKTGTARDFQEWIDDLADIASLPESRATMTSNAREAASKVPAVITERYLADLTRRLNHARHRRARFIQEWDRLVQDAGHTQAILDSKASKRLDFGKTSPHSSFLEPFTILTPSMRYHLHVNVVPAARLVHAAIFSLASVCVIWSEIIKFPAPQLSIISLSVIHHPDPSKAGQIGFGGQLIASAWILYMCAAALYCVTDAKVWGDRALVRRNTYTESACWYAGQIAKLTVPLSYNFITFLPKEVHQKTTFYQFLGRLINLTPLGKGFDYFFPILILLPVCATLFNLYGKIKNIFGYNIIEDEDDEENPSGFGTGGWREGRDLIERESHSTSALGLSPRPSADLAQRPDASASNPTSRSGAAPTLWVPPAEWQTSTQVQTSRPTPSSTSRTKPRSAQAPEPEEEEENFFQLFGRRVRNTFETANKPQWMQGDSSSSSAGFKRPKWMGGNADGDDGGETRTGLSRWFGAKQSDGRLRI